MQNQPRSLYMSMMTSSKKYEKKAKCIHMEPACAGKWEINRKL